MEFRKFELLKEVKTPDGTIFPIGTTGACFGFDERDNTIIIVLKKYGLIIPVEYVKILNRIFD